MSKTYFVYLAIVIGLSWWQDQLVLGIVGGMIVAVSWQIHVLEVKMNKLLDSQGLYVTKEEINE